MLTDKQLLRVYALLGEGMTASDCGGPCHAFCCSGAAVKYLLPGEEHIFSHHHPHVPLVWRPWYLQVIQDRCCCVRRYRMFACRAFPFRPVLDASTGQVIDLTKVDNPLFAPCWVDDPLPQWRRRSIEAWKIVLGDADNRRLYGRVAFLSQLLKTLGNRFYDIPEDRIDEYFEIELARRTKLELERLYTAYFPTRSGN